MKSTASPSSSAAAPSPSSTHTHAHSHAHSTKTSQHQHTHTHSHAHSASHGVDSTTGDKTQTHDQADPGTPRSGSKRFVTMTSTTTTTTTSATTGSGNNQTQANGASPGSRQQFFASSTTTTTEHSSSAKHGSGANGTGNTGKGQAPPNVYQLEVTLEELFYGCTKRLKVQRMRLNAQGILAADAKILEITIKPGWKSGTKVTFEREGDESEKSQTLPPDIVFVINEKKHDRFRRHCDHLLYTHPLKLSEALQGTAFTVTTIDGRTLTVDCSRDAPINPKTKRKVVGEGMPSSRNPEVRGDLLIDFDIKFPDRPLDEKQCAQVVQALNGF